MEIVYSDLRLFVSIISIIHIVYSFGHLVIQCDGLRLLDVAQGGHIKQHPIHIIGVTSNLSKQSGFRLSRINTDYTSISSMSEMC